jgi:hypothetical protein
MLCPFCGHRCCEVISEVFSSGQRKSGQIKLVIWREYQENREHDHDFSGLSKNLELTNNRLSEEVHCFP